MIEKFSENANTSPKKFTMRNKYSLDSLISIDTESILENNLKDKLSAVQ